MPTVSTQFADMMERGAGRTAPDAVATLYREAFDRYGAACLWSRAPSAAPTIRQALGIAETLRREGDLSSRQLAERIEHACRAAL